MGLFRIPNPIGLTSDFVRIEAWPGACRIGPFLAPRKGLLSLFSLSYIFVIYLGQDLSVGPPYYLPFSCSLSHLPCLIA